VSTRASLPAPVAAARVVDLKAARDALIRSQRISARRALEQYDCYVACGAHEQAARERQHAQRLLTACGDTQQHYVETTCGVIESEEAAR